MATANEIPTTGDFVAGSHGGSPPNVAIGASHDYWWDDHMYDIARNTNVRTQTGSQSA
jgi:hypothetical protein